MLSLPFDGELDELFNEAVKIVTEYDRASASLIQRRMSIGYSRAARIIDQLEIMGVVGPADGSIPREVLLKSFKEFDGKVKPSQRKDEDFFEDRRTYIVPKTIKLSRVDTEDPRLQFSDLLNSKDFKLAKAEFLIPFGLDENGKLFMESLDKIKNLVVVGHPQSKKESLIDTILLSNLLKYSISDLKFIFIDPTHYLDLYDGIPHLLTPVIHDHGKEVSSLRWAMGELNRRMKIFSSAGVRDFDSYSQLQDTIPLPRILIVDFLDWVDVETEDGLKYLTGMGERGGVNLILVSNRASNSNIPAEVKSNIPNRAVFAVTTPQESSLAGVKGSERLKPGEFQVKIGSSEPKKLTGIYVPDMNVKEVVEAVKNSVTTA